MARADHLRRKLEDKAYDRITVDWSQMLSDVLDLISQKLTNVADHVRFRCVCRSWRSNYTVPPQLPWLLLPFNDDIPTKLSFLNLSDSNIYTFHLPEARQSQIYGSPHGWLVMLGAGQEPTASLLNPITRAHIRLHLLPSRWRSPYVRKVVLSANPASSPTHQVLVAIWVYNKVIFCTLGDQQWTVMDVSLEYMKGDFVFHEGVFYFADKKGRVMAHEIGFSKEIVAKLPLNASDIASYFVESSGDLLLISDVHFGHQRQFVAFKLDKSGQSPRWIRVEGTGDSTLFLSPKQSVCIHSSNGSWCNGSSIYCAVDDYTEDLRFHPFARVCTIGVSAVGGGTIHERPYFWQAPESHWMDWKDSTGLTWIVPSM